MDWDIIPEWLKLTIAAALSALGTVVVGVLQSRSNDKKINAEDRTLFTTQMMERLNHVEEQLGVALQSLAQERQYCDERLKVIQDGYEKRLEARDRIIAELREQIASKQTTLEEALRRITQLEQAFQGAIPEDDGK